MKHLPTKPKSISNTALAVVVLVLLVSSTFAVRHFTAQQTDPQVEWQQIQANLFGQPLSGQPQVAGVSHTQPTEVRIPVLMYHHIGPLPAAADKLRKDLTVDDQAFELQVAWLKGHGYNTVTLAQIAAFFRGEFTLPQNPVALTFDDGYDDTFKYAVPILKKYGYVGSFAVITNFPGQKLGTNSYENWQGIKAAQKAGMEIVSHTEDHFDGGSPKYDEAHIRLNLKGSIAALRDNLGITVPPVLIYPYGHRTETYVRIAKEMGFEMAYTTDAGSLLERKNLLEAPRVRVHGGETLERFGEIMLEQQIVKKVTAKK